MQWVICSNKLPQLPSRRSIRYRTFSPARKVSLPLVLIGPFEQSQYGHPLIHSQKCIEARCFGDSIGSVESKSGVGVWESKSEIRNLGIGVWGSKSGTQSLGFEVWDLESGIRSLEFKVWDSKSGIRCPGSGVGPSLRNQNSEFGFGIRTSHLISHSGLRTDSVSGFKALSPNPSPPRRRNQLKYGLTHLFSQLFQERRSARCACLAP